MQKQAAEWDEQYTLSLPLGEDDKLERKGTRLLDLTVPGTSEDSVRDELAKQLSAFANTEGGNLIYGLTNDGKVDNGGISRVIRGRTTTKEWLDDVIPKLTDYEIVGVNVHEIPARAATSQIHTGKALYIVDIPASDRAPHQSTRDLRYYVRLGGRSQPASHRLIEDIRNRSRYPDVQLDALVLQVTINGFQMSSGSASVLASFNTNIQLTLTNRGRIKATNTCLLIEAGGVHFNVVCDARIADLRAMPGSKYYWELNHPLYPEMETSFSGLLTLDSWRYVIPRSEWQAQNGSARIADIMLPWKLFADSAPPKSGVLTMRTIGLTEKVAEALKRHAGWVSLGIPDS